jgi:hypothetical protein
VTLRVEEYSRSQRRIHLEVCPACGYDYDRNEDRQEHIADHDPEDFGLSPLGETNEEAQGSLWGGEDLDCIPDPEGWCA